MSQRPLLYLLGLTILVVAGALWVFSSRAPQRESAPEERVLPVLEGGVNDVNEVRIVTAGDKAAVTLKRSGKNWQVMERSGYPADFSKLSELLIDLRALRVVEPKTATPERYSVIGVEDVKDEKATGVRIDLLGLEKPVSLIVGKVAGSDSHYVRVAGEAQSVLAKPQLSIQRDPSDWLDRRLLDIPLARVQEVKVSVADAKPYAASRKDPSAKDFEVAGIPKGRELSSSSAANPIAEALSGLHFTDVASTTAAPDANAPKDAPKTGDGKPNRTEYRLFDGTVLTLTGRKDGDTHWLQVDAAFDAEQYERFKSAPASDAASSNGNEAPAAADEAKDASATSDATPAADDKAATKTPSAEEVKAEAGELDKRFEGWRFEIPGYQYEAIFRPLEDLLKARDSGKS